MPHAGLRLGAKAPTALRLPISAPAPGPWTPASIGAALKFWVNADVGVSKAGSVVTAWADQSGNGNNLTTAVNAPTWGATAFNGAQAGITMVAASQQYLAATNVPISGSAMSIFMLLTNTTSSQDDCGALSWLGQGQTKDYDNVHSLVISTETSGSIAQFYANGGLSVNPAITPNSPSVWGVIFNGSTAQPYINGIASPEPAAFSGVLGDTKIDTLAFGSRPWNSGSFFDGCYRNIFIATADLTANLSDIAAYFQTQGGP